MKVTSLLVLALAFVRPVAPDGRGPGTDPVADIAVAPFVVEGDRDGVLRALADNCLEHLVRGLVAKGVTVARTAELSERGLQAIRPVPLALLGRVYREEGQFRADLRVLEVESGDELRSYFLSDKAPGPVADNGTAVAVRIARLIEERKGEH